MVTMQLIDEIDAALPQTQCRMCDYPSCRDYASAVANKQVSIDRCHPGGTAVLAKLGHVMQVNTTVYSQKVTAQFKEPSIVEIDEKACIGCTKCLPACPVDAIIGSGKKIHSVIATECSGCNLCIPVCPVDCITIVSKKHTNSSSKGFKSRYNNKIAREAKNAIDKTYNHNKKKLTNGDSDTITARKAAIMAALARAKSK